MLAKAIYRIEALESELIQAINSENQEAIKDIDVRLDRAIRNVLEFRAEDAALKKQQVDFLLNRVTDECIRSCNSNLFEDVKKVIGDYIDTDPSEALGRTNPASGSTMQLDLSSASIQHLGNSAEEVEILMNSDLRVSIIDLEGCYVKTSRGNADYYQSSQDAINGIHVADMIGEDRYFRRAKMQLERSYSGTYIRYFHEGHCDDGNPSDDAIMSCEMLPYRPSGNEVRGAIVIMRQVDADAINSVPPTLCQLI